MSTKHVKHDEPQTAGAPVTANGTTTPSSAPALLSKLEQKKILNAASRLTPRQRQLIYYLTEGMSLTEAGERAGYASGGSAGSALRNISEKMPAIMDRLGLADEALIEKYLMPLLVAEETKFFQFKGEVGETRQVQALDIRLRALDLACKLKGRLTPEPPGAMDDHSITVNIVHVGGGA